MDNPVTDQEPDYKLLYEQSLKTLEQERETLKKEREKSRQNLAEKEGKITELSFELDKFRRYLFGQKNEKLKTLDVAISQLNLFELGTPIEQQEALGEQAVGAAAKKAPKKRAKGTGRMPLPEHLRRVDIVIEPDEDTTGCVKIGEEITEVLDIIPEEFYVKRYIRPKYAKPNHNSIAVGELPERIVHKGIPSERLIAQMIIDKYVFGMPLHRLIAKYRRLGVNIPASTASDWIMKGWKHLSPLWELLQLMVANQKYLQADETVCLEAA